MFSSQNPVVIAWDELDIMETVCITMLSVEHVDLTYPSRVLSYALGCITRYVTGGQKIADNGCLISFNYAVLCNRILSAL